MSPASKGLSGILRRALLLPNRYGLSPDRLRSRLGEMQSFLQRWETVPTIPVTGILLDRYPDLPALLREVDVAIHGYRHVPYASIPAAERMADLDAACAAFDRHAVLTRGFRAPYLRSADDTIDALGRRGFLFDSSKPRFALPRGHPAYASSLQLATMRYGPGTPGVPDTQRNDLTVELPVALPDDEILIDGLGMSPSSVHSAYQAMLDATAASGGSLVLQVHPERFPRCEEPLRNLLARATDMGAWKAPLAQIAKWILDGHDRERRWPQGKPYAIAVTGDLDAMTLGDFASRIWGA